MAFGSFDADGAEGVAGVVGFGLVVAVGVEEGGDAVLVGAEEEGGVLAFDHGVASGDVGVDVIDLAEEEAEGVEEVDAGLEDEEAFVVAEEGLAGEVGVVAPAIAEAGVDVAVEEVADGVGFEEFLDFAIPGLPAPVLVDHAADAGFCDEVGEFEGFVPGGGEGFLADDGDAEFGGDLAELEVGFGRGDDVDEVGLFGFEHLAKLIGGVGFGDVEFGGEGFGFFDGAVAVGDDLDFGDAGPGLVLEAREISCSDDDSAELFHDGSLSVDCGDGHGFFPRLVEEIFKPRISRIDTNLG